MAGCVLVLGSSSCSPFVTSLFELWLQVLGSNLEGTPLGRGTPLEWLDSARGKAGGNTARQPGSYSPTLTTARHLPTARQPDMPDSPTAPRQAPTWGYHGHCHGSSDSHNRAPTVPDSSCHTVMPTELRQSSDRAPTEALTAPTAPTAPTARAQLLGRPGPQTTLTSVCGVAGVDICDLRNAYL